MAVPAAAVNIMMFTVPTQAGQMPAMIYALVTNLLLTAVIYTMIATPFGAVMIVRTNSQSERSSMGVWRAVGTYDATLEAASTSMRYSIYGFSNYLPLVINVVMFLIFTKFDLEKKLPQMRAEVAARRER